MKTGKLASRFQTQFNAQTIENKHGRCFVKEYPKKPKNPKKPKKPKFKNTRKLKNWFFWVEPLRNNILFGFMSAVACAPPPPPPPPPPNNLPEWATKISVNRSKLEKALKRQKIAHGRLYACVLSYVPFISFCSL